MKVEEIERLLAEFYEGNTTEGQEEALRDYFRTAEVPGHLQKDKGIFLALCPSADEDVEVPAGLEEKLGLLIDRKAGEEKRTLTPRRYGWNRRWVGSVAATLLLLVGIGYGVDRVGENVCPPMPQGTCSDPEEAYRVLQATLPEISANLNEGLDVVEETCQDMKRINQEVRDEIKR